MNVANQIEIIDTFRVGLEAKPEVVVATKELARFLGFVPMRIQALLRALMSSLKRESLLSLLSLL